MTRRHQIELESVSFILIAIFSASFFVWKSNHNFQQQFYSDTPVIAENTFPKIVAPTLNPVLKIETSSQISPDGTRKLAMKKTHNTDGTLTYLFTVTDGTGSNEHEIYTTKSEGSENLNIPFNAWSPDDKYVFIQKNESDALVFKATGEPIIKDQEYFDVGDLFKEKIKNVTPTLVTGWASETLLIVNTQKEDATKGPSYWFEVPSKAIIQLSSAF